MILTKTVIIKCNYNNKERFLLRGYPWEQGKRIEVNVSDLSPYSAARIDVKCFYCKEIKVRRFHEVHQLMKKNPLGRYSCFKCGHLQAKEIAAWKQSKGLLKRTEKRYWSYKENRLKELKKYIEEYGTLEGMYKLSNLPHIFFVYDHDVKEAIIELGYSVEELTQTKKHYDDYHVIKGKMEGFKALYKRLPSYEECKQSLQISMNHILKYGGMNKIKTLFELNDSRNTVYLKQLLRLYFEQHGIDYTENKEPFSNYAYRSDFTAYLSKKIHIEIWEYPPNDYDNIHQYYNENRREKERVYTLYAISYLSLYSEDFQKNTYEKISNLFKNL